MNELIVTVPEAARRLSVSTRTAERLIASGELRSVRVGRLRRVTVADLDVYVENIRLDVGLPGPVLPVNGQTKRAALAKNTAPFANSASNASKERPPT